MGRKIATLMLMLLLVSVAPFFPIHISVAPEPSLGIRWSGENIALKSVSWRSDNSYGLLVSQDGKLLKYDGYNFEVLNLSLGFTPYDVAWKPDNSLAVMVGSQGHIVVYDGVSFSSFSAPNTNNLNKVSWKSDGAYALVAGNGGTLLRFD